MKIKSRLWFFWRWVRDFTERRMASAWFMGGNCDSACPNCKKWESKGNCIETKHNEDGSEHRACSNCEHEWDAVFTPAGFVPVDR